MTMQKVGLAINASAFICSSALVGISIAAIYLASDAYDVFTERFPPGSYGWQPSHWYGDNRPGWSIFIHYDRSSEVKTYIAAAIALFVGLLGAVGFGLSVKRPIAPVLPLLLLGSAASACIAAVVCVVWSACAEVSIKKETCWFEPKALEGHHYTCSIENSACNALRFSDEASSADDYQRDDGNWAILDRACLQFRHARYSVIPLAMVSLLLVGLYSAQWWLTKGKRGRDQQAEARVRELQLDN